MTSRFKYVLTFLLIVSCVAGVRAAYGMQTPCVFPTTPTEELNWECFHHDSVYKARFAEAREMAWQRVVPYGKDQTKMLGAVLLKAFPAVYQTDQSPETGNTMKISRRIVSPSGRKVAVVFGETIEGVSQNRFVERGFFIVDHGILMDDAVFLKGKWHQTRIGNIRWFGDRQVRYQEQSRWLETDPLFVTYFVHRLK